ncbi:MAG: hypothetical protein JXR64_05260 [Spirochaetales bacterium]|nr:hypothetical protein [Spirochaetales bacterium]
MLKKILIILPSLVITVVDIYFKIKFESISTNQTIEFNNIYIQAFSNWVFPFAVLIILLVFLLRNKGFNSFEQISLWIILLLASENLLFPKEIFIFPNIKYLPSFNIGTLSVAIATLFVLLSLITKDRRIK